MGNVIEFKQEPETVQVLIPKSDEYTAAVNALSAYLAGLSLCPNENDRLGMQRQPE